MTKGRGKTPGAGGLNKHIKTVVHKERQQPAKRRNLGPLEKHKDYVKRSGKRKIRQKRVAELKRAAATRNPDEFNVKMTQYATDTSSGKMRKVEQRKGEGAIVAAVRAGQTDARFLERKAAEDRHRARQLTELVGGLDARPQGKHTVFVDSHRDVAHFNAAEHFGTTRAMLSSPAQRGTVERMGAIRVGHALDRTDDATLVRRFQRGDFDWDEELQLVREAQQWMQREQARRAAEAAENEHVTAKQKERALQAQRRRDGPLQDTRSLRESLLAPADGDDGFGDAAGDGSEAAERRRKLAAAAATTPAVLLRMLRRAAVHEAQFNEEQTQLHVARSAKEVVARAQRADKLMRLAAVVKKKTQANTNRLNERKMSKFRPGVKPRTK